MTSTPVTDDSHWRDLRSKHIGSSEVAALFGLHGFGLTRWQLYHLKRGTLPDVWEDDAMRQGRHFEPAIAAYAAEKFDIKLRKVRRYLEADDCPGLGASIDYEEYGSGSLVPTELKWSLWGDGWDWQGDELTSAPEAYLLQVQAQLACSPNAPHGQLIAFCGGDVRRMITPRNAQIIEAIKAEVNQFWADIRLGHEPPVDFYLDSSAISKLAYDKPLRSISLPPTMSPIFDAYVKAKREMDRAETEADARKAEIIKYIVDAGPGNNDAVKATCGGYKLSLSKVADSPGKEVTAAMVGTMVGARKGYLRCQITEMK